MEFVEDVLDQIADCVGETMTVIIVFVGAGCFMGFLFAIPSWNLLAFPVGFIAGIMCFGMGFLAG